jgi:hypothetical protein
VFKAMLRIGLKVHVTPVSGYVDGLPRVSPSTLDQSGGYRQQRPERYTGVYRTYTARYLRVSSEQRVQAVRVMATPVQAAQVAAVTTPTAVVGKKAVATKATQANTRWSKAADGETLGD